MPIKNYTTEVPAMKSVGQIQGNLAAHGAKAIMIDYGDDKEPSRLTFIIPTPQGDIPFRLPVNVKAVSTVLLRQLSSSTHRQWDRAYQEERRKKAEKKASRVAWRIIKDWVDAQLAIIESEMVTLEQVFLPYMQVKGHQTLYDLMVGRGFLLEEGRE